MQFKEKGECLTYHDQAVSQQASVTECTCKIPPEGVVPEGGAIIESMRGLSESGPVLFLLVSPSKIVCLARSFRLHAHELGNEGARRASFSSKHPVP